MVFRGKLSQEQKIDYIYSYLKGQDRRANLMLAIRSIIRILIILAIVWFYFFGYEKLKADLVNSMKDSVTPPGAENVINEAKKLLNF